MVVGAASSDIRQDISQLQSVGHPRPLGVEVTEVIGMRWCLDLHQAIDLNSQGTQHVHLTRVVGGQTDGAYTQVLYKVTRTTTWHPTYVDSRCQWFAP